EFAEEIRCPLRAVILEGIVKERAWLLAVIIRESLVKPREILIEGIDGVGIEHVAFAAGGGALNSLGRSASKDCVEPPLTGRGSPSEVVARDFIGEVELLVLIGKGHQALQLTLRQIGFQLFATLNLETFEDDFG